MKHMTNVKIRVSRKKSVRRRNKKKKEKKRKKRNNYAGRLFLSV